MNTATTTTMNPASDSMDDTHHHFITPLDVLFLRGNKLFGDPGSHGESLVPPWPSVAAGALRSQLLAHDGVSLSDFAQGKVNHPSLGTPAAPGPFMLTAFQLAQQDASGQLHSLHAMPADLVATGDIRSTESSQRRSLKLQSLRPVQPHSALQSSSPHAVWPLLPEAERSKAASGLWLTQAGWHKYLSGKLPDPQQDLVESSSLWAIDPRVGIGLNVGTRSADDGKLFTAQAVAFKPGVGFVASVRGVELPRSAMLRLGGDGRAARSQSQAWERAHADLADIVAAGRCRLVLSTPGIFPQGWLPYGFTRQADGHWQFNLHGVRARLVSACVPRPETVSGWDLARWQPKTAERAAPAGSVYWLDDLQATPAALRKLAECGLWTEAGQDDQNDLPQRRAEGFNRFDFAAYTLA